MTAKGGSQGKRADPKLVRHETAYMPADYFMSPMGKQAPSAIRLAQSIDPSTGRLYTKKAIAAKLGISQRYVYRLLQYAREKGMVVLIPDPLRPQDMPPEIKRMTEPTEKAFEEFFNRYSGRVLQPIHKTWVKDALSSHRVLINCPPRHAKSTIFSVWFPIWLVCRDRNMQILICSQTDTLAKKFTNEISYHFTSNQDLIRDFGRFRPQDQDWPWRPLSGELLVDGRSREYKSGDLTIQVRGAGQQILGMEANWVVVDDPVSRKIVRSEQERKNLSDWFHGDVMSRLEPDSRAIVIGQRLHFSDLYGELSNEKVKVPAGTTSDGKIQLTEIPRWKHLNYPAVRNWDRGLTLWPEKWTFEALMDVYQDVGGPIFEAMYQQNPLPDGQRLAQLNWIHGDDSHPGCTDKDRIIGEGNTRDDASVLPVVRVLSLDPSPTRFAGLIVADVPYSREQFNCSIIELKRDQMRVRDMLHEIERCIALYHPDYFIFEKNAAQRWFMEDPRYESIRDKVRTLPHTTSQNKADPIYGIESLGPDFEFGKIRFPYGDPESRALSQLLIDEATQHPQGQTDDLLMALWFIKFNYRKLVPRTQFSNPIPPVGGFPASMAGGYGWWQEAKRAQQMDELARMRKRRKASA